MRALIPVLAVAVIAVAAVLIVAIRSRVGRARRVRRELARHEEFLDLLHKSAIDDRDVDPYAALVADQIRIHLSHSIPDKRRT